MSQTAVLISKKTCNLLLAKTAGESPYSFLIPFIFSPHLKKKKRNSGKIKLHHCTFWRDVDLRGQVAVTTPPAELYEHRDLVVYKRTSYLLEICQNK